MPGVVVVTSRFRHHSLTERPLLRHSWICAAHSCSSARCFNSALVILTSHNTTVAKPFATFRYYCLMCVYARLGLTVTIVPPVALVLAFWQRLAQHIRWTVALTALCDVLLFWDELFYYESFGLFAVLILVQLAATGAAAFRIYNKQRKD